MTRPRRPGQGGPPEKERAFELLFREQTSALVGRWLTGLGVPLRDRKDLAQEVLFAAYLSFNKYNPEISRPERWLNRITVHTASHYLQRAQHRYEELVPDDELPPLVDPSKTSEELLISDQERLVVLELMQQLDADAHWILVGHDLHSTPMADLAQQRGIPLSTAYKWRARAMRLFHDILVKRRREDRKREGFRLVLPLDLAALLATARISPRVPDDVRASILRGVQEAVGALKAGSAGNAAGGVGQALSDAATWLKGLAKLVQLPALGVAAPVAATAAAATGAAWFALHAPEPPPPQEARHVVPALVAAMPPRRPAEPPAPPVAPPAAPASVEAPRRSPPAQRRARVPPRDRGERAPAPVAAETIEKLEIEIDGPGSNHDIALFDAVTKALQARDPDRAIAALQRYEREMPNTLFASERKVLWIRAFVIARRYPEARALLEEVRLDTAIQRQAIEELDTILNPR
ncbi:ECF-family RNA polymerase sigma factor [Sorangium cellulosum So ce56]|uniref:ECF-family RNA polymerase sigma factor n=1 Tax=Sorangium cellulosum (strain So ce56) TaxID=448385 RepID=A9FSF7_SORC5|nr:sigma-70 family RNA polymerase sigma factor [Sorangium cellulosum]CAN95392.1 ECF-family RNA polymerase sigma factor [Sorangium cellulosum So ce56]